MRGKYLHNHVLLDPIESRFRDLGASTHREFPTRPGSRPPCVDLLVQKGSHKIAVEVELRASRLEAALAKAAAVNANELWILVPTPVAREACRKKIEGLGVSSHATRLLILTLGQARQRLREYFPSFSLPNCVGK